MFIENVSFENYRNLVNDNFFPSQGINVLYGDNAQGKTNLLEGMWLLTGGRSFRGAKDRELIQFGQNHARVKASFRTGERRRTIEILIHSGKRKAFLNDVPKDGMSQIIGIFCAVIFSPNHMTLIKNGPDERRNFTDSAICQIRPSYAVLLGRYRKILNERNALLKSVYRDTSLTDTLDIWDDKLAHEGALIARQRYAYLARLAEPAAQFYDGISDSREKLEIAYQTSCGGEYGMSTEELHHLLFKALKARQQEDIVLGYTSKGIHRDDMTVKINGREAKSFGSQGQQRSAVLAMKLAEASLLGRAKGESPVILLDDVLSELDKTRQDYLLHRLNDMQVFITCCGSDIAAQNKVLVRNGSISKTGGLSLVPSSGK